MSVTLSSSEIVELTGYEQPTRQLQILKKRGFHRAYIGRRGVVLERAHFEAVCRGQVEKAAIRTANLSFFGGTK